MKIGKLLRDIHHWASPIVMLPLGIMIIAGIFLMLKKDIEWIQPATQRSEIASAQVPDTSLAELYAAAAAIAKFIASNRWEAQIDLVTLDVLSLEYRRSDLFEQIHDGSFFADWIKTFVFLPVGVVLLVLWATGIWLFLEPYLKRWQRKKRRAGRAGVADKK